jgi:S-adenosylmethionine:tRNA ribosyltransferase-isomerase
MIHLAGAVPLPPYIKRAAEASDAVRYQTVYARSDGSVAAPTAGLHFTEQVFTSLAEKNIQKDFVTLHVGAGTFKPVKSATMAEHTMHAEYIDIHINTIENTLAHLDKAIVAVGTTSLRTLESLYWLGLKLMNQPANPDLEIHQWEPYEYKGTPIPAAAALQALLEWMKLNDKKRLFSKTQLMIAPGYQARIAKGLITNFHQPQSTLLLLVAALAGKDWKKIYDYALQHDFRFLSYGDGSLVWFL